MRQPKGDIAVSGPSGVPLSRQRLVHSALRSICEIEGAPDERIVRFLGVVAGFGRENEFGTG